MADIAILRYQSFGASERTGLPAIGFQSVDRRSVPHAGNRSSIVFPLPYHQSMLYLFLFRYLRLVQVTRRAAAHFYHYYISRRYYYVGYIVIDRRPEGRCA